MKSFRMQTEKYIPSVQTANIMQTVNRMIQKRHNNQIKGRLHIQESVAYKCGGCKHSLYSSHNGISEADLNTYTANLSTVTAFESSEDTVLKRMMITP